jgi:hypothetical protein
LASSTTSRETAWSIVVAGDERGGALGGGEGIPLTVGMVEVLGVGVAQRLALRHRTEQLDDVRLRVEDQVRPVRETVDERLALTGDPPAEALINRPRTAAPWRIPPAK